MDETANGFDAPTTARRLRCAAFEEAATATALLTHRSSLALAAEQPGPVLASGATYPAGRRSPGTRRTTGRGAPSFTGVVTALALLLRLPRGHSRT